MDTLPWPTKIQAVNAVFHTCVLMPSLANDEEYDNNKCSRKVVKCAIFTTKPAHTEMLATFYNKQGLKELVNCCM